MLTLQVIYREIVFSIFLKTVFASDFPLGEAVVRCEMIIVHQEPVHSAFSLVDVFKAAGGS